MHISAHDDTRRDAFGTSATLHAQIIRHDFADHHTFTPTALSSEPSADNRFVVEVFMLMTSPVGETDDARVLTELMG